LRGFAILRQDSNVQTLKGLNLVLAVKQSCAFTQGITGSTGAGRQAWRHREGGEVFAKEKQPVTADEILEFDPHLGLSVLRVDPAAQA